MSCEQVSVRLIVPFTEMVVNSPVVGAPSLCAHLFRALSDMLSIRAPPAACKSRALSVTRARAGAVLSRFDLTNVSPLYPHILLFLCLFLYKHHVHTFDCSFFGGFP